MIHRHPAPLRNFDYIGLYYYSLTWCCFERKRLFREPDRVDLVKRQIMRASNETEIEIVAYCFMPDHLHQLVKGCSPTADCRRYMRLGKQYSGFHFSSRFNQRLWQRYGHDRVLWRDDQPRRVIRYIVENPVRAGLVDAPADYPFTGSLLHTMPDLLEWAYAW
jgi:putative transposase